MCGLENRRALIFMTCGPLLIQIESSALIHSFCSLFSRSDNFSILGSYREYIHINLYKNIWEPVYENIFSAFDWIWKQWISLIKIIICFHSLFDAKNNIFKILIEYETEFQFYYIFLFLWHKKRTRIQSEPK